MRACHSQNQMPNARYLVLDVATSLNRSWRVFDCPIVPKETQPAIKSSLEDMTTIRRANIHAILPPTRSLILVQSTQLKPECSRYPLIVADLPTILSPSALYRQRTRHTLLSPLP